MTDITFRMEENCADLIPCRAHEEDAGFDLRAKEDSILEAGKYAVIPTGLFLELPVGFEAQVRPRSGLAAKFGVTVLNAPGTIDAGYRGEVGVILINHGAKAFAIHRGERIAQMVIQSLPAVRMCEVKGPLLESSRGSGGFGSTGQK
ncbi:MAG: dUTP diphosphatase [Lentisphaeria bacterium]